MAKRYYEQDGNVSLLKGKTIAIIGYGSQGHAHALNLRDSGLHVIVGLPESSSSRAKAESAGLNVLSTAEAAKAADVMMILVPDHVQGDLYASDIAPHLTAGKTLMFAHGFNIHFGQIARARRRRCLHDRAQGARPSRARAVHRRRRRSRAGRRSSEPLRQSYRKCAGVRHGPGLPQGRRDRNHLQGRDRKRSVRRTSRPVRRSVSELIRAGFETLVEAGYAPEIAYFECLHELKLIVDLIYEGGLSYMRFSVSDTAEYGDYTRGPRIINEQTRAEMKKILGEIQSGQFARDWINENKTGRKNFLAMREAAQHQPVEKVGAELRKMMTFLKKKKEVGVPAAT